jgi:hypothetical protein
MAIWRSHILRQISSATMDSNRRGHPNSAIELDSVFVRTEAGWTIVMEQDPIPASIRCCTRVDRLALHLPAPQLPERYTNGPNLESWVFGFTLAVRLPTSPVDLRPGKTTEG